MSAWRSFLVITGVALLGACSTPNAGTSSVSPNTPEARRYALMTVPVCFNCEAATGSGSLRFPTGATSFAEVIVNIFDVVDKGATGDLGYISTGTGPTVTPVDPNSVVIIGTAVTFTYTPSGTTFTVTGDTATGVFTLTGTPNPFTGTLATTRTQRCELLDN